MKDVATVRFIASEPPYGVGDVDEFPRATAERLVAKGSAEIIATERVEPVGLGYPEASAEPVPTKTRRQK